MKATSKTATNTATESSSQTMEKNMKEIGSNQKRMDKGPTRGRTETKLRANGKIRSRSEYIYGPTKTAQNASETTPMENGSTSTEVNR